MEIICELKDFKKDEEIKSPPHLEKERYLYIYKNGGKPVEILFSEFEKLYTDSKKIDDQPQINNIGVESGASSYTPLPSLRPEPNFNQLMEYLIDKLNITEDDFQENELTIQANLSNFLELPWEDITNKDIVVYREVKGESRSNVTEIIDNNLLFVISYANKKGDGNGIDNLKDGINKEVSQIIKLALSTEPKFFKFNDINISKHTHQKKFEELPWEKYNYIHFIMHGDEEGSLCLENSDINDYKKINSVSIKKIEEKLQGNNIFLLFFSLCNSGGSLIGENIAFKMTFSGVSKFVIAYRYGAGENSALNFAEIFYKKLVYKNSVDGKQIKDIYKESLSEYREVDKNGYKKYQPLLYINK